MRELMVRYPHASVIVLILITLSGYVWGVRYYAEEARKQAAHDQARTFLDSIIGFHKYYSKEIVPRIKSSGGGFALNFQNRPESFPFPASVSIEFGNALQSVNPHLNTKIYSDFPFPGRKRVLDDFEEESLAFLMKNPQRDFAKFETRDGVDFIRYSRAMVMADDCVECHNRPEFGFQGKWKLGDIRGARQVSLPVLDMAPIIDAATITALIVAVAASLAGGILVLPVVWQLRRSATQASELAREKNDLAEQLDQRNKSLQASIEAKRRFLAGVSHDLRTPLNAILGFSDLLKSGPLNPEIHKNQQAYAGYVHESGLHLQGVIDQVLEISALEEGGWTPNDRQIDLSALMLSLRGVLQGSLHAASLKLQITGFASIPWLRADEPSMRRLLTNLVDNAAKYSGGTGVEIEAKILETGELSLSVCDDGRGVDASEMRDLVNFGVRMDEKPEIDGKSRGIGLWMVDTLMKAHDGRVEFGKPDDGNGLRVSLIFPSDRVISKPEGVDVG
jgi:signal transduction histidine kinase